MQYGPSLNVTTLGAESCTVLEARKRTFGLICSNTCVFNLANLAALCSSTGTNKTLMLSTLVQNQAPNLNALPRLLLSVGRVFKSRVQSPARQGSI